MMKCLVLLLAFAVTMAVRVNLAHMVQNEVMEIVAADSTLTVDTCTAQCDSLFNLVADQDETLTDQMCAHECAGALGPTTVKVPHTHHHHHTHTDAPTTVPVTVF